MIWLKTGLKRLLHFMISPLRPLYPELLRRYDFWILCERIVPNYCLVSILTACYNDLREEETDGKFSRIK